jgi:hypothetical protein
MFNDNDGDVWAGLDALYSEAYATFDNFLSSERSAVLTADERKLFGSLHESLALLIKLARAVPMILDLDDLFGDGDGES